MILFGFYCFLLVMIVGWIIEEEVYNINSFFYIFGNDVFCFIIVVFIGKDYFDCENIEILEFVKNILVGF